MGAVERSVDHGGERHRMRYRRNADERRGALDRRNATSEETPHAARARPGAHGMRPVACNGRSRQHGAAELALRYASTISARP